MLVAAGRASRPSCRLAWTVALCAAVALPACSQRLPEAPRVDAVTPARVAEGEAVAISLSGSFALAVRVSYVDHDHSYVDAAFAIRIGDAALLDVAYRDQATLSATFPAGLGPGTYDVTVTDPAGRVGTLAAGFTVVPRSAVCELDAECADPCHSQARCVDGLCELGAADKDSDGDGFVDATCPGGTDCDDEPASCGSGCYPGNPADVCDGWDNDCDGVVDGSGGRPGWWDATWSHRRRLTFDNGAQAQALVSFPVLVVLRDGRFDYGLAAPGGTDLRFVGDDDSTELPYHIESWDPAGDSFVWVRVGSIDASSSSDFIWMYYGKAGAPSVVDESGTFDAAVVGAWHLHETSGALVDSARGISCTWLGGGAGTQDARGQIDGAIELDGAEDSAACGTDQIADTTAHTITAWVKLPLTGDSYQEIVANESLTAPYPGIALYVRRNDGAISKWLNGTYHSASTPANLVAPDEWTYLALRGYQHATAGYVEVSKNGGAWETIYSGDTSTLRIDPGTPLVIGKWAGPGPSASTRGLVDEIRIANTARSDEWIRADYRSTSDTFITYGPREEACR